MVFPLKLEPELVISAQTIGAADGIWKDQLQLDVRGCNYIGIFVEYTKNNSSGSMLQCLPKHSSSTRSITATTFDMSVASNYQWTFDEAGATMNRFYLMQVTGIPFLQLQTKATTIGASVGTITIRIAKYT